MICNTIGLTADSFESIYTTGGTEVEEVYGAIDYGEPIYAKIREITGTSPLTFTSRVAGTLTDYRISGETLQDGTPSPDMPVDVVGCGVRTENLWDGQATIGSIKEDGTAYYHSNYFHTDFIACKENQSYAFFQNPDPNVRKAYLRGVFFYSNNNENSFQSYIGRNQSAQMLSFTTPENCTYLRVLMTDNSPSPYNSIVDATAYSKSIAVVEGETPPQYYAPYGYKLPITVTNGTDTVTTPVYIGAEPLHRIGEYADYVDYSSGKIMRKIRTFKLITGSYSVGQVFVDRITISNFPYKIVSRTAIRCNYNITITSYPGTGIADRLVLWQIPERAGVVSGDSEKVIKQKCTEYFKQFEDSGKPVTIYYVLAEPIEEDPPVPFPALPTFSGINTMSVDTTVKPSQMYIKGKIKPDGYGNLTDKNGVYILDKDGVQLTVHGQGTSNA